jgi:uncharacterized protein YciI
MLIFARGTIQRVDSVPKFIDEENRVVAELKASGLMKEVYRRAAGPGVINILEAESIEDAQTQMGRLPFVAEGIMTLEYDEIYPI